MLGSWRIYQRTGASRYVWGDYTLYAFVWPITGDIKFKWEKDGVRWRKKMSTPLTFINDCVLNSYRHFKEIEEGADKCGDWVLAMMDTAGNVLWKGFINYTTWEVDEDRQTVKMTPEVFDEFTIIYENMNHEFNIMNSDGLVGDVYAYYDVNHNNTSLLDSWRPARIEWFLQYNEGLPNAYYIDEYGDYNAGTRVRTQGADDIWHSWFTDSGVNVYGREMALWTKAGGDPCFAAPAGTDWILLNTTVWMGLSEYCAYVREILTYPSAALEISNTCTDNMPDVPVGSTTLILLHSGCEDPIVGGDAMINIWLDRDTGIGTYSNIRYVKDVIEWMLSEIGFTGSYASVFFDHADDYMYGGSHASYGNRRNNLMIAQKSDIRVGLDYITFHNTNAPEVDHATKGIVTLKEMLDYLKIFNVDWWVDSIVMVGDFRIENERFFEYGYQDYVVPVYNIEHDLRGTIYCKGKNSYTYSRDQLPKYERFKLMEAGNIDFQGVDIYYDTPCTSYDLNNVKEYNFPKLTTDLKYVHTNAEDISNEGFCLLAYIDINGQPWIASEKGKLSNAVIVNGHLSWANLHHFYWTWGRVVENGYLNDDATVFDSFTKQKIQTEITLPYCQGDSFNPYNCWYTDLGGTDYGFLVEAEEDVRNQTIRIKLKFP